MDICKEIKDLILTDYLDGQTDDETSQRVDGHLSDCADCRSFATAARKTLLVPFEKVPEQEPPAHLWASIRGKIQAEKVKAPELKLTWYEQLIRSFDFVRLAPFLAAFTLFVLIGPRIVQDRQASQRQDRSQEEYLVSILDTDDSVDDPEVSPETPLETYFL